MPEHSRRPRVRAPTPRAAGATSASETLYRGLVEDQTELVSLATPGGELTFVNRAYARWHGLRADEMVGRSLLEFVPEPDRAAVAEHLRRVCEVRESLEAENQVTRPNGETCWFAWTNRALFDAAGRVTAIHSVGRDIEWRVAAEQRVRQSEARFRLLAENSIDMILLVDRDGKRVYVSPSCRPMLGFEPEEMLRLNTREALHPDDAPRVLERLARSGEDSDTLVYRMRRKDGGYVWVESRARLFAGEPGQTPQRLLVVRDIEQRVATESRLRESEAQYRLLADTSSDMVFQLGLDLSRVYVSPACREIIGYEPEELIGRVPVNLSHPDDAERVADTLRSLLDGRAERRTLVNRIRHRDGRWVWVEAELRTLRDPRSGSPTGVVGAMRDISERKRQAEALEQARDAAEAAGRVQGEFLANMSHELRTPLTGMLGVLDLLRADPDLGEARRRLVKLAEQSGRALLLVVNDVLDYSKLDAGKMELSPVRFSLADLVEGSVSIVAGFAADKRLQTRVSIDRGIPDHLVGDDGRLRQVLLNLLNNAVKFTRAGHVAVSVAPIGAARKRARLRFEVSDTGIGIAKSKIGRLFQRFSQVDGSTSREFGGSGLGLAISKRLIEVMGGEIGVASRPGLGSNFWFTVTLPVAPAAAAAPVGPDAQAPRRWARILVAEDIDINQDIVRAMLGAAGHEVDIVSNGADAVRAVMAKPYDVVLMDVQMPGVDGVTATRRIRALPGSAGGVPVIAMTANVLAPQIARFRASGMNDHVGKPFKRDELLDAVARNLRSADPDESVSGRGREARDDGAAAADREALTALLGAEKLAMLRGKLARRLEAGFARDPASADARGALAREAHKLASSAGALGFPELSRRCAILEAALRAEIEADVAQALDAVREASASAIAEIAEPGDGRPERPALPFSRR